MIVGGQALLMLQCASIHNTVPVQHAHTDHWALAAVCSTSSALKLNWTPVAVEPTCTR